jgi:hypothetical protein
VPAITILLGLLLTVLGLAGYVGTGQEHKTALIPAAFGLAFLVLGLLGRKDNLRKHAMHAAAVLGLVGFLGNAGMLLRTLFSAAGFTRPVAAVSQLLMAVACLVFVALCVKSFVDARRARRQRETVAP